MIERVVAEHALRRAVHGDEAHALLRMTGHARPRGARHPRHVVRCRIERHIVHAQRAGLRIVNRQVEAILAHAQPPAAVARENMQRGVASYGLVTPLAL